MCVLCSFHQLDPELGFDNQTYAPTCPALAASCRAPTQIIELDRARLLRNEQRALEAKHNGDPLRHVSCQADAAGQIGFGLPMQDNVTHGTDR